MARSEAVTHKIISAVKSKGTEPELLLRKALWKDGFRYRVNDRKLADKLKLSVNTIKTFCRRNQVTGVRAGEVVPEDLSATSHTNNLFPSAKGGNSTATALVAETVENTGVSRKQPTVRVKLAFADETAVPDVMRMLMEGKW